MRRRTMLSGSRGMLQVGLKTILVGVALVCMPCLTPSSANADWAYTHWGMTPEQVVAASSGTATVMPPAQRTREDADHWELAAEGTYVDNALHLSVGFTFDTQSGGLKCVMYNAREAEVTTLQQLLIKRYGKALKDSSFGGTQIMTWDKPDKIELVIGQRPLAAVVSHCAPDRG